MPQATNLLAHRDIQTIADRALANSRGVKIACGSQSEAFSLRMRFYNFRKIDRSENRRLYDGDHPMWGRSVYDQLKVYAAEEDDGSVVLVLEVSSAEALEARVVDL